ncbi:MAG: isopeptide-forming domain-containing fimbrial protein [Candidatus Saccharimonas sp.]|nr:MAG: isopeptide-forming domain-containing fimbrial protein [Candidatus Saccharimonas sp.]
MARQSWKTYIARLKQAVTTSKQATVKHLGIGMMVIAMVLQSVVFFQDYAQAASDDMIQGGVGSKEAILAHYDKNTNNFRDVLTYNGITRAELANISSTKVRYEVDSSAQSWGWTSRFSEAQGQKAHTVAGRTIYSRPQKLWDSSWYMGWEGSSATRGKFRIMSSCGNLLTYSVPQVIPVTPTPQPKPQPAATCDSLTITQLSRNRYHMSAKASAKNGATIQSIYIRVYDPSGKLVDAGGVTGDQTGMGVELKTPGTYKAQATAVTSLGEVTSPNCTGSFTITEETKPEEPKPSVSITKTVNKQEHIKVAVNSDFTYEITVKNTGKTDLKDVAISDNAPKEVTLSTSSAGKVDGAKWTHTIANLPAGQSQTFSLTAKYAKFVEGKHKNTACVDTPTITGSPDACDDATTETYTVTTPPVNPPTQPTPNEPNKPAQPTPTPSVPNEPTTPPTTNQTTPPATTPQPTPTAPTTKELPLTGTLNTASGILGLGGLVSVTCAYVMSRRSLR